MLFDTVEVYENNSIIGVSGETNFNNLSLAIEYFMKVSDRHNNIFNTVYLLLK